MIHRILNMITYLLCLAVVVVLFILVFLKITHGTMLPDFVDTTVTADTTTSVYNLSDKYLTGDCNGDGYIDVDDLVFLMSYIFQGGPESINYNVVVKMSITTDTIFTIKNSSGEILDVTYKQNYDPFANLWIMEILRPSNKDTI